MTDVKIQEATSQSTMQPTSSTPPPLDPVKKEEKARVIYYVSSMMGKKDKNTGYRSYKTMDWTEVDQLRHKEKVYLYEYLTDKTDWIRLFFDFDKIESEAEYHALVDQMKLLAQSLGSRFSIGGYTRDESIAKATGLRYEPTDYGKLMSIHVVFYDIYLTRSTYKHLMTDSLNNLLNFHDGSNKLSDMDLGDIPHVDCTVYKFKDNQEQLLRMSISDKEVTTPPYTSEIKYMSVVDSTGNPQPTSTCLAQCDGHEKEVTLDMLEKAGIYQRQIELLPINEPATATIMPSFRSLRSLHLSQCTSESTPNTTTLSTDYNNRELNLLSTILACIHDSNGEVHMETCFMEVAGIVISALSKVYDRDVVEKILLSWYYGSTKHTEQGHAEGYIRCYWDEALDPKYEHAEPSVYLKALVKHVPDAGKKRVLKQMIKDTFSHTSFKPDPTYRDATKVEYITSQDIRSKRTTSEKVQLIATSTRYCLGLYLFQIDSPNFCTLMDEEVFKRQMLGKYFNRNVVADVASKLKQECSCEGQEYIAGFSFRHIYKGHPLSGTEDQWVSSRLIDIVCFQQFLFEQICQCNPVNYQKLLNHLAWILQHPGQPSGVVLDLFGVQGTGKTLLGNLTCKLHDIDPTVDFIHETNTACKTPFATSSASLRDFTGNFNDQVDYHIVDVINETRDTDENTGRTQWNSIKRLTDPMRRSEGKGKQTRFIENTTNLIITTNCKYSLVPDYDDRRLFALEMNPAHDKNDREYWTKIRTRFSEPGFVKHIFDFLMSYNTGSFDPHYMPDTELNLEIKETALSTLQKFVVYHKPRCDEGFAGYLDFRAYCQSRSVETGKFSSVQKMWEAYCREYCMPTAICQTDKDGHHTYKHFLDAEKVSRLGAFIQRAAEKGLQVNPNDDELTSDELATPDEVKDLEKQARAFIDTHAQEKVTRQSRYRYIRASDIPPELKSIAEQELEADGYKHCLLRESSERFYGFKLEL